LYLIFYISVKENLTIDYYKHNIITTNGLIILLQVSSSVVITTFVDDVNDNSPYFVNAPYGADISESTPIGNYVLKIISKKIFFNNLGLYKMISL